MASGHRPTRPADSSFWGGVAGPDKFTERARRVLTLVREEAQRPNYHYVGTERLLLGLIREGGGIGAGVLRS